MRDPQQIRELERALEATLDGEIDSLCGLVDLVLARHARELTPAIKKVASTPAPAGVVTSVSQEVAIAHSA
jgi:hypothetical protein